MEQSSFIDADSAGAHPSSTRGTVLHVCTTCNRDRAKQAEDGLSGGERFLQVLRARFAGSQFELRAVQCLMGCDHPCNVHLCDPAKYSYVIGRFDPTEEAASALADYASLYAESDTGQVPYKQWPQAIKGHFVARLPPLDETP